MNNAEIIKGIDMTIEGLNLIKSALLAPVEKTVEEVLPAPEEVSETPVTTYDVEALKSMKYNDFKKLASSLGVKCTGTRDEIMERILALNTTEAPAEEEEEKSAEEPVEKKGRKSSRSKKPVEEAPAETTRDEFDEQAEAIAESTDVEDIIEALADVDIKATKKNAVTKLAEALRNGLIELDDDDDDDEDLEEEEVEESEDEVEDEDYEESEEDDEESEDEDDDSDGEEITADSYFSQYDPEGYNDPEVMTEERKEAVEALMAQIIAKIENGEISADDVDSFLEDFATDDEKDLMGDDPTDDDFIMLYMELNKRFIDNDGEAHEPSDPYEVGEEDFCCGHPLKYVKKTKKYVCEHCGAEYEAE